MMMVRTGPGGCMEWVPIALFSVRMGFQERFPRWKIRQSQPSKESKRSGLVGSVVKNKAQRKDSAWWALGAMCSLASTRPHPCISEWWWAQRGSKSTSQIQPQTFSSVLLSVWESVLMERCKNILWGGGGIDHTHNWESRRLGTCIRLHPFKSKQSWMWSRLESIPLQGPVSKGQGPHWFKGCKHNLWPNTAWTIRHKDPRKA